MHDWKAHMTTPTVGISLGGGGARGLAHIAVLETLDDMGVSVSTMSGTSIGAIIGALYSSGMPAKQIRRTISKLIERPHSLEEARASRRLFGWLDLLGVEFGRSHLLQVDSFIAELGRILGVSIFEDLQIPLQVVASDFWERKEVVFSRGPLLPAISASFCLPGIFRPVVLDGTVLVDGGCVNPVPFDLIRDQCDILIAVDVLGKRAPDDDLMPSFSEAIFNTYQIAETTITAQKLKSNPPDILLEPAIKNVRVLEFHKAEQIYCQSAPACQQLVLQLEKLLDR
jgi:NTE family protein